MLFSVNVAGFNVNIFRPSCSVSIDGYTVLYVYIGIGNGTGSITATGNQSFVICY